MNSPISKGSLDLSPPFASKQVGERGDNLFGGVNLTVDILKEH